MRKFIVDVVHDFGSSLQPDVGRGFWHVSNTFLSQAYAAVTPRRVTLTCVQRVAKFYRTSSHARHGQRTILIRFANAVHVLGTFWLAMARSHALGHQKSFEHAQNFFSWPACVQRVSWHVVARPKYVRGALVRRRTSFADVLHSLLTRWAYRWSPNAGECNHIHYKVWS